MPSQRARLKIDPIELNLDKESGAPKLYGFLKQPRQATKGKVLKEFTR